MTSTIDDNKKLIDDCYTLCLELINSSGDVIKQGYQEATKRIETKSASWDLVTEYDLKSEELIINGIKERYPDHKFISEESAAKEKLTDEPTWVIDPIDGTSNFIRAIPIISVSIAFVVRKETVFGVIFNPILNELYTTRKTQGAFLNGKQIFCSKVETLDGCIYAHEVSFARVESVRDKNIKRTYKFAANCQGFRSLGCATMTMAYVARGTLDGYQIDELFPWDIAAGSLLIQEAGGSVYKTDGTPLNIMEPQIVCAATEKLCQQLIAGIKEADKWTLTIA